MHASLQRATQVKSRIRLNYSTLPALFRRTRASSAALRLVATAAGAGASKRRMAEAAVSCSYTDLEDGIKRLLQLPGPHYVLFMADPDPATGMSWCPDCVRCGPAVKNVMADKKASLLEVLVGQRPVWKDPQHPLRHHPQIKLSGVPDVMRWGADGPTAKMGQDLEKAGSPAEAVAVVAAFVNKTA